MNEITTRLPNLRPVRAAQSGRVVRILLDPREVAQRALHRPPDPLLANYVRRWCARAYRRIRAQKEYNCVPQWEFVDHTLSKRRSRYLLEPRSSSAGKLARGEGDCSSLRPRSPNILRTPRNCWDRYDSGPHDTGVLQANRNASRIRAGAVEWCDSSELQHRYPSGFKAEVSGLCHRTTNRERRISLGRADRTYNLCDGPVEHAAQTYAATIVVK